MITAIDGLLCLDAYQDIVVARCAMVEEFIERINNDCALASSWFFFFGEHKLAKSERNSLERRMLKKIIIK